MLTEKIEQLPNAGSIAEASEFYMSFRTTTPSMFYSESLPFYEDLWLDQRGVGQEHGLENLRAGLRDSFCCGLIALLKAPLVRPLRPSKDK